MAPVRPPALALIVCSLLTIAWSSPVAAACGTAIPPADEAHVIRESGIAFSGYVIQRWGQTSLVEVTNVWVGAVPSHLVTINDCSDTGSECNGNAAIGATAVGQTYLFFGLRGDGPFYSLPSCASPATVDPKVTSLLGPATAAPNMGFRDVGVAAVFVIRTAWWAIALLALAVVNVVLAAKQIWDWNPYRQGITR
jgi:hypothetical protein